MRLEIKKGSEILTATMMQTYESKKRNKWLLYLNLRDAQPKVKEIICAVTKEPKTIVLDNSRSLYWDSESAGGRGIRFEYSSPEEGLQWVKDNTQKILTNTYDWNE